MNRSAVFVCFISLVIIVYSLMNYYFIKKHKNIMTFGSFPGVVMGLLFFTLMLTPIMTLFFSRQGHLFFALISGFIGYSWLAFLFLFLVIHLTADIALFLINLTGFDLGKYTAKVIFIMTIVMSITILFYGRYEARQIQVERVLLETDKLPTIKNNLIIVLLSDIHFSALTGKDTAVKIYDLVQKENPDLLLFTGDFMDKGVRDMEEISAIFSKLMAPMGKYAVTGNHEFIAGIKESSLFIEKSGFKLLRNEAICLDNILNIAAVDDAAAKMFGLWQNVKEKDILANLEHDKYTIFLKHQPKIEVASLDLFDLQLSGHTHAGQIFPFSLLVKIVFPYIAGLYDLGNDKKLYVSRGTGTWGPPFRFLALPEITIIELRKKS